MKITKKTIQKSLAITAVLAFLVQTSASAFTGAMLKGINIDRLDNHSYQVTIKTDKDVPIKKYVTASNKVVLDLQNVRPAQFVNTVYNGTTEVDHVVVQPYSNNKLRIFMQGLNIASSKILLDTRDEAISFLQTEPAINTEQILLNERKASQQAKNFKEKTIEPIIIDFSNEKISTTSESKTIDKVKSVTPILSYAERNRNNFQTVNNSMSAAPSLNNIFNGNLFDWVLRILMVVVIITAVIKFLMKPKKVEINLSTNNLKDREINLYKETETRKERITKSLGMPNIKESAAKKPNYSSISQYGLKEYQNSQLPPRKTISDLPARSKYTDRKPVSSNPPLRKTPATAPNLTKNKQYNPTKVARKQTAEAKENFDGVKFLETMATIYQKSGRTDLATGIRQNLINKKPTS